MSRIHRPRLTGEVRVGFDVTVSTAAWVGTPPRPGQPGSRGGTHSVDAGNAVMPREAIVHEGEIGAEEIQDGTILAHDGVEE